MFSRFMEIWIDKDPVIRDNLQRLILHSID